MPINKTQFVIEGLFGDGGILQYPHWDNHLNKKKLDRHVAKLSLFICGMFYGADLNKMELNKIIKTLKKNASKKEKV